MFLKFYFVEENYLIYQLFVILMILRFYGKFKLNVWLQK